MRSTRDEALRRVLGVGLRDVVDDSAVSKLDQSFDGESRRADLAGQGGSRECKGS